MRNAVIRKKRLKAERIVDEFMRMPQRIIVPQVDISWAEDSKNQQQLIKQYGAGRLWAL